MKGNRYYICVSYIKRLVIYLFQADKPSTPVSKATTPTGGAGSSGSKAGVPAVVLPPGAYPPFSLVAGGVGGSRSSEASPYNSVAPSPYSRPPMVMKYSILYGI